MGLHAFDEKGFTFGKGGRKRIIECRRIGIATMPPADLHGTFIATKAAIAWNDGQIVRGWRIQRRCAMTGFEFEGGVHDYPFADLEQNLTYICENKVTDINVNSEIASQ